MLTYTEIRNSFKANPGKVHLKNQNGITRITGVQTLGKEQELWVTPLSGDNIKVKDTDTIEIR
jgi:hypothetical protein